jgi:NAD(P)H-dependent FMN reductase
MSEPSVRVLAVVGSLRQESITRVVVRELIRRLDQRGCATDLLDLADEPLPLYNPDTAEAQAALPALRARLREADVLVLGTPDYHGSISGPLKNFLDHFWHELAGKLCVPLVASHEKGLTALDQLRTVARQCYAWALPYGVSFTEDTDVREGRIVSDQLDRRLTMVARDAHVYGDLLARQRRTDLAGSEPGFLARHRED